MANEGLMPPGLAYLGNNITDKDYSEYGVLGGWPVERAYFPSPEFNILFGLSIDY